MRPRLLDLKDGAQKPPCMTEFIGTQLLQHIRVAAPVEED